ncbi:MAG: hypothetical protein DWQ41_06225 [Planctomycetota bacterium]|nr:MAG: hypothetical protein DWQ41_06225 [Planctomycetota bacterium]
MNTISRSDLQQFVSVARQACRSSPKGTGPPVTLVWNEGGGTIHTRIGGAAVELKGVPTGSPQSVTIPFACLVEISKKGNGDVAFEDRQNNARIRWNDGEESLATDYEQVASQPFPKAPLEYRDNPGLLAALDAASRTASQASSRYTLQCLQLQGKTGRIVATDGHQLLVQNGFQFPWDDDLLIPASKVFGNRRIATDEPVSIGKTDSHVFLVTDAWTLAFPETAGRFPEVESFLPKTRTAGTRLQIAEADAEFLLERLPTLPGREDDHSPVTVDLNGQVVLRAADDNGRNRVEIVLSQSGCKGRSARFSSNRQFLARALNLGFREVSLPKSGSTACCLDGERSYVWALLDEHSVVKPGKQMERIVSPTPSTESSPPANHQPKAKRNRMPQATSQNQNGSQDAGIDTLIEQAEDLKSSLKDSLGKVNEFVTALKRQKKQARLVRSTLASLKQLQTLDA